MTRPLAKFAHRGQKWPESPDWIGHNLDILLKGKQKSAQ